MKQKKLVSMIGALIIMIIAVALITGCPQQPNNKKDDTTKTGNTGNTGGNNGGNTGGNNDNNGGGFAPFTASYDETLWESENYYRWLFVQKGKVYKVEQENDWGVIKGTPEYGTVKNGQITLTSDGTIKPISIDDDGVLKIGKGAGAEKYSQIKDPSKINKVKKAISGT